MAPFLHRTLDFAHHPSSQTPGCLVNLVMAFHRNVRRVGLTFSALGQPLAPEIQAALHALLAGELNPDAAAAKPPTHW